MPETLIQELRNVVQSTSGIQQDQSRRRELHSKAVKSMLAPSLAKIHDYLSEFKQHLASLDPETDVTLSLRQIGSITDLQQMHYKLVSGTDPLKSVILTAELVGQEPVKMGFQYEGNAGILIENLKQEGLVVLSHNVTRAYTPEQTILMEIGPKIPVRLEFKINPDEEIIDLIINNFEELGERRHTLTASEVNDEMLDQLGKYILRRENDFLTSGVSWGYRKRLREKLDADLDEKRKTLAETAEVVVGRLRNMLAKKEESRVIQLSFRDQEIELSPKELPYRLGRKNVMGMVIESSHASRQHATIISEDNKVLVCDHSNNGTFVKPEGEGTFRLKNGQFELAGRGLICLGEPITDENEDTIYYCYNE